MKRRKDFARMLAAGKLPPEAAITAGYSPKYDPYKLANGAEVRALVAIFTMEDPVTGPDLAHVIATLMEGAKDAMAAAKEKKSAAGFAAARGLLAEAARLKQTLPPRPGPDEDMEWALKWGPED
jgi:hypothetical protein